MRWIVGLSVFFAAAAGVGAQSPTPRLARVDVRQIDGQPPVLEVVANAPLAFRVLGTEAGLDLRIYGVQVGLVPRDQQSSVGRVTLTEETDGNVRLRLTASVAASFDVRLGTRPNVIEIVPRP